MIAIIDYGMGNLFSIYNALVHINASAEIISEPPMLSDSDGIVIPGVGAFGKCMERLLPFKVALLDEFRNGTPILGICIGQQVLFQRSKESPGVEGLGWMK
jgi:glutamine amidotransferase